MHGGDQRAAQRRCGLDADEAAHFTGRVDGPDFTTRQLGNDTAADAKTTSAARAWRRSAVWLQKLRIASNSKERLAVCWRLFHYKHPRPEFAEATEAQRDVFAEFEAWRTVVGRTYLNDSWVDIFRNRALEKVKQQEGQAQRAHLLAWQSWMHEGPADGLRKQHQFTKVEGGWVEAVEIVVPQPLEDSQVVEDGVPLFQLQGAPQPAVSVKCPANLQEETDLQARGWHKEWDRSWAKWTNISGRSMLAPLPRGCWKMPSLKPR